MLNSVPTTEALTLVERVMAAVRTTIAARADASGARLPSIRRFAEMQGVSKSTVVEAFDRLVAEGAIVSRPGSGFYVAGRARAAAPADMAPKLDRAIDPFWVMRQSLETAPQVLKPGWGCLPDEWLPGEAVRRALRSIARDPAANVTAYGSPAGFGPLRSHVARELNARGIPAEPGGLVLTDSDTAALDLTCRLVLQPGDAVLVDDPCYFNFQALLHVLGARVFGVPMTPGGPDLDAFAALAAEHRPRLYLTNATLHNPTGATLSAATAHQLLKIAESFAMTVVEDDSFADFEGEPTPRLAALDGLERVVHVGSFSKTLSAAVRCGFIAAPAGWTERLIDLKLAAGFGNNDLGPQIVHRMLADGFYRRHVERLRSRLAGAMAQTIRRVRALGLTPWLEPRAGMFLWARLPDGLDSAQVARQALERGVVLAPGNVFSASQSAAPFLRFNVSQSGSPRIFEVLGEAMAAA